MPIAYTDQASLKDGCFIKVLYRSSIHTQPKESASRHYKIERLLNDCSYTVIAK